MRKLRSSVGRSMGFLALAVASMTAIATAQTRITYVPARPLTSHDGAAVYEAYCASCHGATGHGDGPAARLLEHPVPDLTLIEARDGTFRVVHVQAHILDSDLHVLMPDWGRILSGVRIEDLRWRQALVAHNLARHIESLQARPASR